MLFGPVMLAIQLKKLTKTQKILKLKKKLSLIIVNILLHKNLISLWQKTLAQY